MKILTNPCVENRFQFLSYFSPFLDRFERYYPFGKGAPSFNFLFHTSIVLFRIRNILLKIFPIAFPPPRLYNSVSHFEMARRENKNGYLSFHFHLSEIRTPVLARPIKKRYLYFLPHSCWISLFHAYSSRARNWIFLGAAEAPAAKSGTKLFSLDERTLIAFIMLWCKTRVRNLSPAGFETSTPAPTSLVVRPFHRIFSSFHLYIYTYYIYYITVMKISCDVSGDAAVSSRTGMITGANTVGLPPLTRGCGGDGEKRGRSRGKERKGGKERHLSISFNPTFPCRLLLSIYYKLFCRSPRGAACPTDGENTRAFHSIKFDKVRRRCTEGGEGYPREFPVIAKSKMARVRARYRARYRWHACRYYHSRDGDSFRDLSIECIEFPCSILNSVNALVRFVPRKFATSLDTNILSRRIIVAIIVAIVHWYLSLIFKFVRVVYWLIRVLSFEKYLKIDFASVSFKYFGWEFVFLKSLSLRSFLIITLLINNIRFYRIKILDSYKLYDKIQSCASFINIYK